MGSISSACSSTRRSSETRSPASRSAVRGLPGGQEGPGGAKGAPRRVKGGQEGFPRLGRGRWFSPGPGTPVPRRSRLRGKWAEAGGGIPRQPASPSAHPGFTGFPGDGRAGSARDGGGVASRGRGASARTGPRPRDLSALRRASGIRARLGHLVLASWGWLLRIRSRIECRSPAAKGRRRRTAFREGGGGPWRGAALRGQGQYPVLAGVRTALWREGRDTRRRPHPAVAGRTRPVREAGWGGGVPFGAAGAVVPRTRPRRLR